MVSCIIPWTQVLYKTHQSTAQERFALDKIECSLRLNFQCEIKTQPRKFIETVRVMDVCFDNSRAQFPTQSLRGTTPLTGHLGIEHVVPTDTQEIRDIICHTRPGASYSVL